MKLHHCAFRITLGASGHVQHLFEHLGAELVWEGQDQGREIALRIGETILQFSEVDEAPQNRPSRIESHVAFLSDDPERDVGQLRTILEQKGIRVVVGRWSDTEHWLDCPELFIDFAIEILRTRQ
jgi:hypothetical protein